MTWVRFVWLQEQGIVDSRAQLKNLQAKYDFPPGRMLSPNVRAWNRENEVEPWLAARPVAGPAPRGAAKVAAGRPPKDSQRKREDEAAASGVAAEIRRKIIEPVT
jgi:hypothetical protein